MEIDEHIGPAHPDQPLTPGPADANEGRAGLSEVGLDLRRRSARRNRLFLRWVPRVRSASSVLKNQFFQSGGRTTG